VSLAQLATDYPVHASTLGAELGSAAAAFLHGMRRRRVMRQIIREELGPLIARVGALEERHHHSHPHMRVHHAKGT